MKNRTYILSLTLISFSLSLQIREMALAQWSSDPNINTPVATGPGNQSFPFMVTDGSGGAIIAWWDTRNFGTYDIYAQKVDSHGYPLWTANGIPITLDSAEQSYPQMVSDGLGGAIIVWRNLRYPSPASIYAQKINSDGVTQWTPGGLPVFVVPRNQWSPVIASDGAGGAIMAWVDFSLSVGRIRAQRVSSAGDLLWNATGVLVSDSSESPHIVGDGDGGAVIVYRKRLASYAYDIYAQHLNSSGIPSWAPVGVPVCTAVSDQENESIVADGTGGVIVVWDDSRLGNVSFIFTQRITGSGAAVWPIDGIRVSPTIYSQHYPSIVSDEKGGAIIAWDDARGAYPMPYCQRVSADGTLGWEPSGVEICACYGTVIMVPDGEGGTIAAWVDSRGEDYDIYAQRVDSSGTRRWVAAGQPISTATSFQNEVGILSDRSNGAIIAWQDLRSSSNADLYAQRISGDGRLGETLPVQLTAFTGSYTSGNRVCLSWTTISEINNYGFEVQRQGQSGNYATLTGSFVPGHGTTNESHQYTFVDSTVALGSYWYRLKQVDLDGTITYSDGILVRRVTGIAREGAPAQFRLSQNYPNPFNGSTEISFTVEHSGNARLEVFNLVGQKMATLFDGHADVGGYYKVQFDATYFPSGVYLYKLQSGGKIELKKLVLLK